MSLTRGMRNCNPGNIRLGSPWQGRCDEQTDPEFVQFKDMVWGCRALIMLLRTYRNTYKLNTVEEIIHRYAPSVENPTKNYIARVCKEMNVTSHEYLNKTVQTYIDLAKAICLVETAGQSASISDETWDKAVELID